MADIAPDYIESDCPWQDPEWLLDHPDFPLAAKVADELGIEKEQ